jgi:MATE family multidrug resistance protein
MVFFTLGKYKEILRISLPLVLNIGATTFMEFTDRIFLGWYSMDALAASMPAGITSFFMDLYHHLHIYALPDDFYKVL